MLALPTPVFYAIVIAGTAKLLHLSLSFLSLVSTYVLPPVSLKKYHAPGSWAVVTGALDGIGKEFAGQLAAKGFNLVLVSRTASKLEAVAAELGSVETKVVAFDATEDAPESYAALAAAIADLPVTVLVNNVGQSHSIPVPFLETTPTELNNIVTVNVSTTLKVTQTVVPRIVATTKSTGARGLVLTMGSFAGLLPTPLLAVYLGSKAFLQNWSAALAGELQPEGVDVELVVSYLVASAMSKIRRTSFDIPSPRDFVRKVLASVGRRGGAQERYATSTPYPAHAIMHWFIENTVGVYSRAANKLNLGMHQSIRKRALRKAAKKLE